MGCWKSVGNVGSVMVVVKGGYENISVWCMSVGGVRKSRGE